MRSNAIVRGLLEVDQLHAGVLRRLAWRRSGHGGGGLTLVLEPRWRHGVELPITEQLADILFAGKPALVAIRDLMQRDAKDELDWITAR